jgi:hypothetical protein
MPILGWRVHFTRRQLMMPRTPRPTLQRLPGDVDAAWLDGEGIEDGVPFLISPDGHYDVDAHRELHRLTNTTTPGHQPTSVTPLQITLSPRTKSPSRRHVGNSPTHNSNRYR